MSHSWLVHIGDKSVTISPGTMTYIDIEGRTFTIDNRRNEVYVKTGFVETAMFPGIEVEIEGIPVSVERVMVSSRSPPRSPPRAPTRSRIEDIWAQREAALRGRKLGPSGFPVFE